MAGVNSSHISIAILVLLIFATLSSFANINYVTPHPNTSCPARPCLTLSQYVEQAEHYFTSNTTFVFLDGKHELSAHLALRGISNITLTGNTSSLPQVSNEIKCTKSVNVKFDAASEIKVTALAFASCGMNTSNDGAIHLTDAQNISFSDCVFHDNAFTALTALHSSFILNNVTFANNSQSALRIYSSTISSIHNSTFIDNSGDQGGAAEIFNSVVNFTGTTVFESNSARDSGGSLHLQNITASFAGVNLFRDSHASGRGYWSETEDRYIYRGGGVLYAASVHLVFEGETSFLSSSAEDGGGILVIDHTTINFNGNYGFFNNSAYYGGGIFAYDTTINFTGNCNFINNSASNGGGIYASDTTMNFNGNFNFTNNLASYGGGIFAWFDTTMNFNGHYNFISNSAIQYGGGIYADSGTTMTFNGHYSFINNSASHGGGIYALSDTTMTFNGNYTFISNSATSDGGGIYARWLYTTMSFTGNYNFISNSASNNGGGILASDATMNFTGNCNFSNNLARFGGGILASDTTMNFTGNYNFISNSANTSGGGIHAQSDTTINCTGNYNFIDNSASYGGGISAQLDTTMIFNGNYSFINNSAGFGGGIYASNHTTMNLSGNYNLINNSASSDGGGIHAQSDTCTMNFTGNYNFINNSGSSGGGMSAFETTMNFNGHYTFINNSARLGGGIYASNHTIMNFTGNYNFINNSAIHGGGIFVLETTLTFNGNYNFINNSAIHGGGISAMQSDTTMNFTGNYNFIDNSAIADGGGFSAFETTMNFSGHYNFTNNSAILGGGIYASDTNTSFNGNYSFINNSAGKYGGGIMTETSTINLHGDWIFTNNSATYGGGISLSASVYYLFQERGSRMYFTGNHAQRGGAIHVFDSLYDFIQYCSTRVDTISKTCFLQPAIYLTDLYVSVTFEANSALEAGDDIYGGTIDILLCFWTLDYIDTSTTGDLIDMLAPGLTEEKLSAISSDPIKVCFCNSTGYPDCDGNINVTTYPGKTFTITAVAVGQRDGTVPTVINSIFEKGSSASLKSGEEFQTSSKTCTPLKYTVFSDLCSYDNSEIVNLYVEGLCGPDLGQPLSIPVNLQPCPDGFELSPTTRACICEKRLQTYTNSCDINRQTIFRDGYSDVWVGYDKETGGLILHPHCPFDYCKSEPVDFTLNDTDLQCNYNRSDLLCGNCQPGLSLALGTSQCLECSDTYLTLLVAFVLAGLFLVFFLLICRLTVAVGTISGLIFYANIVAVNQSIFFTQNLNLYGRFLSVFIAWLNLDLGIETCFYNGMDAYAKTWLQFVFPTYMWVLVGLMIISSYYSTVVARTLHGTNPVAVLATLFLLSYTKILRTIIAALSFTNLQYPNNTHTVWLYDGNITYLSGKHIPLFITALTVFLVLFMPYTLLLLTGQFLQANSNHRIVSWLYSRRLKPFMDAYHGPYKDEHRYWPGLLLVVRVILLLTFSSNVLHDPSVNLLAISSCVIGLLTLELLIRGIYKKWCLEALEAFFILNLGILSAATLYVRAAGGSQAAVAYTSVSAVFMVFIGIVAYHMYLQLKDMQRKRQRRRLMALLDVNEIAEDTPEVQVPSQVEMERVVSDETRALVPTTVVVVPKQECEREPLIFDTD